MLKFRRLIKSFSYACKGLYKVFREEQNLRVQSFAALIVLIFGFIFRISHIEWLILIFAIALVILMEVVNSALERVTDVLKPRIDSYVKEIKDIMAAAVMLASITAVIIGALVFLPHLFRP
jgi:diacylglycerol kinase